MELDLDLVKQTITTYTRQDKKNTYRKNERPEIIPTKRLGNHANISKNKKKAMQNIKVTGRLTLFLKKFIRR